MWFKFITFAFKAFSRHSYLDLSKKCFNTLLIFQEFPEYNFNHIKYVYFIYTVNVCSYVVHISYKLFLFSFETEENLCYPHSVCVRLNCVMFGFQSM